MSVSVDLSPASRKNASRGYFAWVIRAGSALVEPAVVKHFSCLQPHWSRQGMEELFAGDAVIEAEKNRFGWDFSACFCEGSSLVLPIKHAFIKAELKKSGLATALLKGAGELPACLRFVHACRLGIANILVSEGAARRWNSQP